MKRVRHALNRIAELDLDIFEDDGRPSIRVDRSGDVLIEARATDHLETVGGQLVAGPLLDLVAPFSLDVGIQGPDLREPRSFVRIYPRKLSGSPHVIDTRVETIALRSLERRGFSPEKIARLYPDLERSHIDDALELERTLESNAVIDPPRRAA